MVVEGSPRVGPAPSVDRDARASGGRRAAVAGVLASAVALGVSELIAGLSTHVPSLVAAVGTAVIDAVPAGVKDLAIAVFGLFDKVALVVGTVLIAGASGAVLGTLAARRFWAGAVGFMAFGLAGLAAASRDPQASLVPTVAATALATAVGVAALSVLLARAATEPATAPLSSPRKAAEPMVPRGGRRQFLRLATGVAAAAAVTAAGGRVLTQRSAASVARAGVVLPPPAARLAAPPDAASLDVDGITPLFTPNDAFFRIDTALSIPRVDPSDWRLAVTGMVDRPLSFSYDDLLAMPHIETDVTLLCVSNEVGGDLAGNARWSGVPLATVLERAGVGVGATQVVGRSVDGWTSGFPTEAALDGRDTLIAVAMNGEPLPLRHGFPARLVVPGLYGYVSATKWLAEIELTTWEGFDAYWIPRGWSKEGPVKTQSRIDVPGGGSTVAQGRVTVAGVAWGGLRGVERVEVSVDGGAWQEAKLAEPLGDATWRQWVWLWQARPGRHALAVRATDGEGAVQTGRASPPAPDGATGHHTVRVEVS
ncbi:MAG TPA: sulfite oxidase [Egibacteraceae bacterium]|nr:sulfite oxidase [Egibacteraceae bacterium]